MTPSLDKNLSPQEVKFEDAHLKKIFLEHLNSIYCGKQHLIHFFEEIKELATLQYLKNAIQDCSDEAENQMVHIDGIFNAIGEDQSKISVLGMKAMTLEAYITAIRSGKTPMERDVFIVFYLQLVEGIEVTYFKVLKNLAKAIGYSNTFLDKPFNQAVEDKLMFEGIYKEYITQPSAG
jgi:ferritin-like metal-binding protein YciE